MKAIASLDNQDSRKLRIYIDDGELENVLSKASDLRIYAIFEALFRNYDVARICTLTGSSPL